MTPGSTGKASEMEAAPGRKDKLCLQPLNLCLCLLTGSPGRAVWTVALQTAAFPLLVLISEGHWLLTAKVGALLPCWVPGVASTAVGEILS